MRKTKELLRIRFTISLFFFLMGIVFATWANRIATVKQLFNLSEATLGTLLFAIPIGQVLAMPLSAWLVNKIGSKRSLIIAALFYPFALLLAGFASTPTTLMICLVLFGMGANLCNAATNTQGVAAEKLYGSTIMASFHGMWSLGGFLGGLIAMAFIASGASMYLHFLAVFALVVLLTLLFFNGLVKTDVKAEIQREHNTKSAKRRIDYKVVALGFVAFAAMICEGCMFDWSGVYFKQVLNAHENIVQLGYVICLSTMALGRFISDYFVKIYGAKRVVVVSGLLIFIGQSMATAVPTLIMSSLGFFLVGFGISSTVPICYSEAGKSKNMNSGLAISTVASVGYLGFLIGPPVIGYLAQTLSLRTTFAIVGCIGLVLALSALKLLTKSKPQTIAKQQ